MVRDKASGKIKSRVGRSVVRSETDVTCLNMYLNVPEQKKKKKRKKNIDVAERQ